MENWIFLFFDYYIHGVNDVLSTGIIITKLTLQSIGLDIKDSVLTSRYCLAPELTCVGGERNLNSQVARQSTLSKQHVPLNF
jgi:hypothetical protein